MRRPSKKGAVSGGRPSHADSNVGLTDGSATQPLLHYEGGCLWGCFLPMRRTTFTARSGSS